MVYENDRKHKHHIKGNHLKTFPCSTCSKVFSTRDSMLSHKKCHQMEPSIKTHKLVNGDRKLLDSRQHDLPYVRLKRLELCETYNIKEWNTTRCEKDSSTSEGKNSTQNSAQANGNSKIKTYREHPNLKSFRDETMDVFKPYTMNIKNRSKHKQTSVNISTSVNGEKFIAALRKKLSVMTRKTDNITKSKQAEIELDSKTDMEKDKAHNNQSLDQPDTTVFNKPNGEIINGQMNESFTENMNGDEMISTNKSTKDHNSKGNHKAKAKKVLRKATNDPSFLGELIGMGKYFNQRLAVLLKKGRIPSVDYEPWDILSGPTQPKKTKGDDGQTSEKHKEGHLSLPKTVTKKAKSHNSISLKRKSSQKQNILHRSPLRRSHITQNLIKSSQNTVKATDINRNLVQIMKNKDPGGMKRPKAFSRKSLDLLESDEDEDIVVEHVEEATVIGRLFFLPLLLYLLFLKDFLRMYCTVNPRAQHENQTVELFKSFPTRYCLSKSSQWFQSCTFPHYATVFLASKVHRLR